MLLDAGSSRGETDCSHGVCRVSSGIVSLGIPGTVPSSSNVTSLRRILYSGNPDILTMAELLIGGRHSQSVLDCFLACRDSQQLQEQLRLQQGQAQGWGGRSAAIEAGTGPSALVAAPSQRRRRAYWANDTVAYMFRCGAVEQQQQQQLHQHQHQPAERQLSDIHFSLQHGTESLLHRAYLQQMLLSTPNADILSTLLRAGADPSAKDSRGWMPDESAAGNHEVLHRFANGYHEFEASRTSMLDMCDVWRGRRELVRLQRLCFAAGVELQGSRTTEYTMSADRWRYNARQVRHGVSPLYLLSADVAEMISTHLDQEPPSTAVHSRWVRYQAVREESATQTRIETWLFVLGGFCAGLALQAGRHYTGPAAAAAAAAAAVDAGAAASEEELPGPFPSSREMLLLVLCIGGLLCLEQVLTEVAAGWWTPSHALSKCAAVAAAAAGYNDNGGEKLPSASSAADRTLSSRGGGGGGGRGGGGGGLWSWQEKALMTVFGLVGGAVAHAHGAASSSSSSSSSSVSFMD